VSGGKKGVSEVSGKKKIRAGSLERHLARDARAGAEIGGSRIRGSGGKGKNSSTHTRPRAENKGEGQGQRGGEKKGFPASRGGRRALKQNKAARS